MAAHSGLRDVQFARRVRETQMPRSRFEGTQRKERGRSFRHAVSIADCTRFFT
jgi:hypothetical protein